MSVSTVPLRKVVPAGLLVTDPSPVVRSVSLNGVRKVAVVVAALFTVVVQVRLVPASAHAPVQPEKTPLPFLAVSVTEVPTSTFIAQVPGHRMTLFDDET